MNASTLIQAAKADGLQFTVSADGRLIAKGKDDALTKWLPTIKSHRDEIVQVLREMKFVSPMSDDDEAAILGWLSRIGETNPVTVGEVIDRCRGCEEVRHYFLGRAGEIPSDSSG